MLNVTQTGISLRRRVLGAGFWSVSGFAISYPLRLGSSLVMTRLLAPEMFGVMSIAMLIMTSLAMLSDFGLRPSIIQSTRGDDPAFLNTGWALQIIRGFVLWLIALLIAALIIVAKNAGLVPVESVYADSYLPQVIAITSASAIIDGFRSTKLTQARRWLSLGRITQIQIASQLIGLAFMISWALIQRSLWALVAGGLCASLVTTVLTHIWLPGQSNRWHWDRSAAHEILHFGKWIFVSSLLGLVANNADRALLAGFVDATTLGIYSIAFTICSMLTNLMYTIFKDVSFSAFSEVSREKPSELKRVLYRFHLLTGSLAYFCAGALAGSGDALIKLLYDPRYEQAGWMLEVLAIGLLSVPFSQAQYALLARGLPKLFTTIIAVRALMAIILIPLGFTLFGLVGGLGAVVASQLSSVFVTAYYQYRFSLLNLQNELFLLFVIFGGYLIGVSFSFAVGR